MYVCIYIIVFHSAGLEKKRVQNQIVDVDEREI